MAKRQSSSVDLLSSSNKMTKSDNLNGLITSFPSNRCRYLSDCRDIKLGNYVLVWMSRDQRVNDNYSLLAAQDIALKFNIPIKVVFNLVPKFLDATLRQYYFMIEGLKEVESNLVKKLVSFHLTMGDPAITIPELAFRINASVVICDFSPLRVGKAWTTAVANTLLKNNIPTIQVDAHNVIPTWIASDKLEVGARTIRSKINNKLSDYLFDFPDFLGNTFLESKNLLNDYIPTDWNKAMETLEINRSIEPVSWILPGETAALAMLHSFGSSRLNKYENRNDPNVDGLSNLSPYFHFGQLSAQRAILFVKSLKLSNDSSKSFIEEALVRRELSENFCYYNSRYDSIEGASNWAIETLRIHSQDERPVIYTVKEFEDAMTHDDLWNASQLQMVNEGKMHGFLRMYWAKKILEWSTDPDEALRISIYLNDKYELDGRDPNGYVGCMWSIAGVHDQGWGERPIFGKIRYMNYKGCQRKFDVSRFVSRYPLAKVNSDKVIASGKGKKGM